MPERTLLAESFNRAVGRSDIASVEKSFTEEPLLVKERKGRRMATTPKILAEERRMVAFAREGRGTCRALGNSPHEFSRTWLGKDQKAAVNSVRPESLDADVVDFEARKALNLLRPDEVVIPLGAAQQHAE